jgi:hypothetical protein
LKPTEGFSLRKGEEEKKKTHTQRITGNTFIRICDEYESILEEEFESFT